MSLTPNGTPWSGPRNTPRPASSAASRAAARAPSRSTSAQAWTRASSVSMRASSVSTSSTGDTSLRWIARAAATTPSSCRLMARAPRRRLAARRRRRGTSPPRPSSPPRPRSSARAPRRARGRTAARRRREARRRISCAVPDAPWSLASQLHVLVGPREPPGFEETEPGFFHARPDAVEEGEVPDRREHRPLMDDLLDPVEDHLALRAIQLRGLLTEEAVDVGVASVRVRAAGDGEGLEPGRGVPRGADEEVDEVLVFLLGDALEERRPLERTQLELDSHGFQVGEYRFAPGAHLEVAEELAGVEAVRVPGLGE